jgi:hypothetical protein
VPDNLVLITSIANQLLEATAATAGQASERVLAQLVDHFDLHYSFLRYSDHDIRAMLAAKWPPRSDVGDPDPFAVVSFTSDHPAFALCENGQDLVMVHRGHENGGYRCPVTGRRRGRGPLVAAAPLISGILTAGVLGFVKCRDGSGLLRRADEAVLASKRGGGNQITVSNDHSLKQLSATTSNFICRAASITKLCCRNHGGVRHGRGFAVPRDH